MANWEIAPEEPQKSPENSGRWEIVPGEVSNEEAVPQESFGKSLAMALPRLGGDVLSGLYHGIANFPNNLPASFRAPNQMRDLPISDAMAQAAENPMQSFKQNLAGLAQLGHSAINAPRAVLDYASNRLHLLPKELAHAMFYQTDINPQINALLGAPKTHADEQTRDTARNILNMLSIGGTPGIVGKINPLNLTSKSIAKDIVNAGERNKKIYGNKYSDLWKEAENQGFGDALYDIDLDMKNLQKFSPRKSIKGVLDFDENPTLQNAHAAKSDLLRIQRDLNKLPTLRTAERQQLKAVNEGIENIQNNMFKNAEGNLNNDMMNKYLDIQKGYAEDVIPYKNKAINKFKRNEISSKELINSLSRGEFAAKKGSSHPALSLRKLVIPALGGLGGAAGVGAVLKLLYDNAMGANPSK